MNDVNLTGRKIDGWEVLVKSFENSGKQYWLCKHECGQTRNIAQDKLILGVIKPCTCGKK